MPSVRAHGMTSLPTLFVSHGAPNMVLESGPTGEFLRSLPRTFSRPRAIVCVSAHFDTPVPTVTAGDRPPTIHDFFGFPEELYRLRYAAPGDPALARRIVSALGHVGLDARLDPERGLDHGAWAPLWLMYPAADIPVVQLSLQCALGARHHLRVGRALAALREEGVLILGSGGATHNLRAFQGQHIDSPVADYAAAFDRWLHDAVVGGDTEALLDWKRAPQAAINHPSPEHLLPLFVPLGAAGAQAKGRALHRKIAYGMLSMAAFGWGNDGARAPGGGLSAPGDDSSASVEGSSR